MFKQLPDLIIFGLRFECLPVEGEVAREPSMTDWKLPRCGVRGAGPGIGKAVNYHKVTGRNQRQNHSQRATGERNQRQNHRQRVCGEKEPTRIRWSREEHTHSRWKSKDPKEHSQKQARQEHSQQQARQDHRRSGGRMEATQSLAPWRNLSHKSKGRDDAEKRTKATRQRKAEPTSTPKPLRGGRTGGDWEVSNRVGIKCGEKDGGRCTRRLLGNDSGWDLYWHAHYRKKNLDDTRKKGICFIDRMIESLKRPLRTVCAPHSPQFLIASLRAFFCLHLQGRNFQFLSCPTRKWNMHVSLRPMNLRARVRNLIKIMKITSRREG